MLRVHLDFETRCDLDLKAVGLRRYLAHPSFRILLTALAVGDDPRIYQWEGLPVLPWDKFEIHAFNAPFERGALRRYGIEIPVEQWRCTMTHAYARGFAGHLADVGPQVGIPMASRKLADGSRLITKFCKPRRPSKTNPDPYWTPQTAPEDWDRFRLYNRQDVEAERAIYQQLRAGPMTQDELETLWWDWQINDRGLPIDERLVANAIDVASRVAVEAEQEIQTLTGLKGSQTAAVLLWCQQNGLPKLPNMQAETIQQAIAWKNTPDLVRRVLKARLEVSQSATKKFHKIEAISHQGRVYDTLQAWGAQRTGRWAGRGLQLQNLKRTPKNAEELADKLAERPEDFVQEQTLEDLGGIVRTAISASEGKRLVVADLSAIESRVLGHVTDCRWINDTFAAGRDTYKAFAEIWMGVPYAQVDKDTRTLAKPPFLGFGYGIGGQGLKTYAEGMGIDLTEEQCDSAIRTARSVCHEVPRAWRAVEEAFTMTTVTGKPHAALGDRVLFQKEGRFLTIRLPSGRKLYYDDPRYEDGELTYLGMNQYTRKWERIYTWGGKIIENIVQAIARDVLLHGMMLYHAAEGWIIGHVHDEVIAEEDARHAEAWLKNLHRCLAFPPSWAPGLLLGSEGYVAKHYQKA